jgi:hypothetical protein
MSDSDKTKRLDEDLLRGQVRSQGKSIGVIERRVDVVEERVDGLERPSTAGGGLRPAGSSPRLPGLPPRPTPRSQPSAPPHRAVADSQHEIDGTIRGLAVHLERTHQDYERELQELALAQRRADSAHTAALVLIARELRIEAVVRRCLPEELLASAPPPTDEVLEEERALERPGALRTPSTPPRLEQIAADAERTRRLSGPALVMQLIVAIASLATAVKVLADTLGSIHF